MGAKKGSTIPILYKSASKYIDATQYANPLTQILMLTAIVVGIATTALGLALVVRIRESYGTIEENDILIAERSQDVSEINGSSA